MIITLYHIWQIKDVSEKKSEDNIIYHSKDSAFGPNRELGKDAHSNLFSIVVEGLTRTGQYARKDFWMPVR